MTQRHWVQEGTFHVTTVTKNRVPWCTKEGVPLIISDNMVMTRNIQKTKVYAFCILPDHVHMLVETGAKGISDFMHSFKRNSSWQIRQLFHGAEVHEPPLRNMGIFRNDIFWQHGFHDERIRDDDQFNATKSYIECNAHHHGLVEDPMKWPWSSLNHSHLLDAWDA